MSGTKKHHCPQCPACEKDGHSIEETDVRFPCPGCGAECSVAYDHTDAEPCLLHALPVCKYYMTREAIDIVTDARKAKERRAPRAS